MSELPWNERVNMLSINPDAANRDDVAKMAAEIQSLRACNTEADARILKLILERDMFRMEAEKRWALRSEIERLLGVSDTYDDKEKVKAIENIKAMKKVLSDKDKRIGELETKLEESKNNECPRCGRSLAPDGDCFGCSYDDVVKTIAGKEQDLRKYKGEWEMACERERATQARVLELEFSLAEKENELKTLQFVCAEAYQMAGAYDAPVKVLDNLSAAAAGKPLPHKTFLPVVVDKSVAALESSLSSAREALELAIDVAQDAIAQESGGGPRPSYFDEKFGWTENIEKCKKALASPPPSAAQGGEGEELRLLRELEKTLRLSEIYVLQGHVSEDLKRLDTMRRSWRNA